VNRELPDIINNGQTIPEFEILPGYPASKTMKENKGYIKLESHAERSIVKMNMNIQGIVHHNPQSVILQILAVIAQADPSQQLL
jgi:hypothetical protein